MVGGVFSVISGDGAHGADHHHLHHATQPAEVVWPRQARRAAAGAVRL
jgi:hypothetical protein